MVNKNNHDHSGDSVEFMYNNNKLTDKKVIAEKFNKYFVNIGENLAEKIPNSCNSFSQYMTKSATHMGSCALHLSTPNEIVDIVQNLKSSNSTGIDEISAKLLKSVISYIAEPLCRIINMCIDSAIFPDKMKIAKVCPIYKAGGKNEFIT